MGEFEIKLEEVRMRAFHGIYDFERKLGNDFEVSLSVKYSEPDKNVVEEDSVFNTISYVALFEIIKEEMATPRNLLETVAYSIIKRIKDQYPYCSSMECSIGKLHAPIPDFNGKASVTFRENLSESSSTPEQEEI